MILGNLVELAQYCQHILNSGAVGGIAAGVNKLNQAILIDNKVATQLIGITPILGYPLTTPEGFCVVT